MTLYEIELLTHIYASISEPQKPPIYEPTIKKFLDSGLIEPATTFATKRTYQITTKGKRYIDALCSLPILSDHAPGEETMTKPHKHAAVIKAWADGAQIQYRYSPNHPWEDVDDPTWIPDDEYRVKPANVVRYLPVMQMPARSVVVGWGVTSKDCAGSQTDAATELKRVLRIELNPDTLELVSATIEKP